jgi:hypothetical protein
MEPVIRFFSSTTGVGSATVRLTLSLGMRESEDVSSAVDYTNIEALKFGAQGSQGATSTSQQRAINVLPP